MPSRHDLIPFCNKQPRNQVYNAVNLPRTYTENNKDTYYCYREQVNHFLPLP